MPKPPFRIYQDPLLPDNEFLMGYKGKSQLDSGYVFSSFDVVPRPPEPSAIDRLAALGDPVMAAKVAGMDARIDEWEQSRLREIK